MIKYIKRRGSFWKLEDGVKTSISAEEYDAGVSNPASIPVPEVREYDSLEEALADQGTDELDRYEDELIAEED